MGNNIIVLTTGLSGSSVVTSFVSQAGYWIGDQTVKKDNQTGKYDTYENDKLVELNRGLIKEVSLDYNNDAQFHKRAHIIFENAIDKIDDKKNYSEFIEYCNLKGSWIWKDPRLWLTIGFWQSILDRTSTKIILLYRDPLSLWISLQNKRQIVDYNYLKTVEKNSREDLGKYLSEKGFDYYLLCYDDLLLYPDKTIERMNNYLDTTLTVNDLKNVYRGEIGRKTWNMRKLIKSLLIYVKNYKSRRKD